MFVLEKVQIQQLLIFSLSSAKFL